MTRRFLTALSFILLIMSATVFAEPVSNITDVVGYSTVTAAVAAASSGDTIVVYDTVTGADADLSGGLSTTGITIMGDPSQSVKPALVGDYTGTCIKINQNNTKVIGLTIAAWGADPNPALRIESGVTGAYVLSNDFITNDYVAIRGVGVSGPTIAFNRFVSNYSHGDDLTGVVFFKKFEGSDIKIIGNYFATGHTDTAKMNYMINFNRDQYDNGYQGNSVVLSNVFENVWTNAVALDNTTNVLVAHNTFSNCDIGVLVEQNAYSNYIVSNLFINYRYHAIYTTAGNTTFIHSNTISNTTAPQSVESNAAFTFNNLSTAYVTTNAFVMYATSVFDDISESSCTGMTYAGNTMSTNSPPFDTNFTVAAATYSYFNNTNVTFVLEGSNFSEYTLYQFTNTASPDTAIALTALSNSSTTQHTLSMNLTSAEAGTYAFQVIYPDLTNSRIFDSITLTVLESETNHMTLETNTIKYAGVIAPGGSVPFFDYNNVMPHAVSVNIDVVTTDGVHVATVSNEVASLATETVTWDGMLANGQSAKAGVYILRIRLSTADTFFKYYTKPFVLIR